MFGMGAEPEEGFGPVRFRGSPRGLFAFLPGGQAALVGLRHSVLCLLDRSFHVKLVAAAPDRVPPRWPGSARPLLVPARGLRAGAALLLLGGLGVGSGSTRGRGRRAVSAVDQGSVRASVCGLGCASSGGRRTTTGGPLPRLSRASTGLLQRGGGGPGRCVEVSARRVPQVGRSARPRTREPWPADRGAGVVEAGVGLGIHRGARTPVRLLSRWCLLRSRRPVAVLCAFGILGWDRSPGSS